MAKPNTSAFPADLPGNPSTSRAIVGCHSEEKEKAVRLESIPKYFSPKSPKLSDQSPATATESLSISEVMAAIGMTHQAAGVGLDLYLAKVGISSPDKAVEGLLDIAQRLAGRSKAISQLDEDIKLKLLQVLATFAYQDYSRSAASVRKCDGCGGEGFFEANVFTTRSRFGARPSGAITKIEIMDKPLPGNMSYQVTSVERLLCQECSGKGVISNSCRCHGKGVVVDKEKTEANGGIPVFKECPRCAGKGYARLPAENVRRAICSTVMDLPETTWRRSYKPFYEKLVTECHKQEASADIVIAKVTK
ncbi:antitermination protein [Lonsdalea quercina]|uniref:antitermination protein n=1 Tax=Lonsdalea quercina TaxID=71657 RepID=UPI0039766447